MDKSSRIHGKLQHLVDTSAPKPDVCTIQKRVSQYLEEGKPEEVEKELEQLFDFFGYSDESLTILIKCINGHGDDMVKFKLAKKFYPELQDFMKMKVFFLRKANAANEHVTVLQVAREILKRRPNLEIAINSLAWSLAQTNRQERALEKLEDFHANKRQLVSVCLNALLIAELGGYFEEAISWAKRAIALNPQCFPATLHLVISLNQVRDNDGVRNVLRSLGPPGKIKPKILFHLSMFMIMFEEDKVLGDFVLDDRHQDTESLFVLAAMIAAELHLGNLDRAVKLGKRIERCPDVQNKAYFVYQEIVSAIERAKVTDQIHDSDKRYFCDRLRHLESKKPPRSYYASIEEERVNLAAIRNTAESVRLIRDQPILASFVCTIHRPTDLDNAVLQISQQTWRNAEVIFAVNGNEISDSEIMEKWQCEIPMKVVDCHHLDRVSTAFNHAMQHASGDVVFKIDADDIYMSDYAADMILSLQHHKADVVSKKRRFVHFKGFESVILRGNKTGSSRAEVGEPGAGGALCFRKEVFEKVQFMPELVSGEDNSFYRHCITRGLHVHYVDPFNYVYVRYGESSSHTWNESDFAVAMLGQNEIVGRVEAIESDARYKSVF